MTMALVHRPSILIIDDDTSIARTFIAILRRAGYPTEWIERGSDALARVAQEPLIDVAIIDMHLPDTDGLSLLKKLKATHPEMGLLMITGDADVEKAVAALNEGAFAYFL